MALAGERLRGVGTVSAMQNSTETVKAACPGEAWARHRAEARAIIAEFGFTNARLFGSVARGRDRPGSDVDILLDVPETTSLFDLARCELRLEDVLGVPVQIVASDELRPPFRARIERDLAPV